MGGTLAMTRLISSGDEPIVNSPGGMRRNFIPMELVISGCTPRCLAHACGDSLASLASNGAMANWGADSFGDVHLAMDSEIRSPRLISSVQTSPSCCVVLPEKRLDVLTFQRSTCSWFQPIA